MNRTQKTLLSNTLAISVLALATMQVQASVTVGAMSRQDGAAVIEDSLNNRQWLGWDVTRGLNYAQTLAAVQSGGAFAGFRVARSADAVLFVNGMLGLPNGCATGLSALCVQTENRDFERLVGESFYDYRSLFNANYDYDYAWFLSGDGSTNNAGGIEIVTQDNGADRISINHRINSIAGVDANLYRGTSPTGWLLFRDTPASVPEPGSLMLVMLAALAGYAAVPLPRRARIAPG